MSSNPDLAPAAFIDSDHPAISDFAHRLAGDATDPVEQARRRFYGVRDEIIYDPYRDYGDPATFRASSVLAAGRGYCVGKASLMAAAARALGIKARLGLADVRNHLATPRLVELMGSDLFILHGYALIELQGRWVKATPTFNLTLCQKFGVKPLEFDGAADALFHPFDVAGRRHMEYVRDHGSYADVPFDFLVAEMRRTYPTLFAANAARGGDFAGEAAATRAAS
jgi:transglutaminase-like putative cysteine protease